MAEISFNQKEQYCLLDKTSLKLLDAKNNDFWEFGDRKVKPNHKVKVQIKANLGRNQIKIPDRLYIDYTEKNIWITRITIPFYDKEKEYSVDFDIQVK